MLKTYFFMFRAILSSAATACSRHRLLGKMRALFPPNNNLIGMLRQQWISRYQPHSKHFDHNIVNVQKEVTFTEM